MPPHGGHGHGGGHHGGGHHGGGHHGGGGRPGGWTGGWGPGWAYPPGWVEPAYAELVVPSCPDTIDPVLATDGRTYTNPCLARVSGAGVVKHLPAPKLAGLGGIIAGVPNIALIAGAGLAAYFLFFRKRRR